MPEPTPMPAAVPAPPAPAQRASRIPRWALFALALLLQFAIIGALVAVHSVVRDQGTPVLLRIAPVDPRDPLRGDYLVFSFADISTLKLDYFGDPSLAKAGRTIYVPLIQEGRRWVPTWGVRDRIERDDRAIHAYIRGVVTSVYGNEVNVTYGIEEYFVPEGKGTVLPQSKSVVARVFVASNGRAQLDRLVFDGKTWP